MKIENQLSSLGKAAAQPVGGKQRRQYVSPRLSTFGVVSKLTQGAATVGTDAGFGNSKMNKGSDRAIKENISRVGVHPLGIGLYLFDYKAEFQAADGQGRQFGVMADEVAIVMPEAVSIRPDGFKQVDYTLLGISREIH